MQSAGIPCRSLQHAARCPLPAERPCEHPPARPPPCHCSPSQVLSWVFSPLLAGVFAAVLFFFTRLLVLRSSRAYERSLLLLPLFVFGTFYLCTWFM